MPAEYHKYLSKISPQYVAELWPPVICRGSGVRVFDAEEREYLDLDAGWGALGLGHCHPEIVEVTQRATATLEHTTPPSRPLINLMDKLSKRLEPYDLAKFFLGTSGSESVEHALMLALSRKPNSRKVMVFDRAYHGSSLGLLPLSFSGHPMSALSGIQPIRIPTPFCYRCEFGLSRDTCQRECQQAFESLMAEHKEDICAVLLEPALGREAIVLPEGYLSSVANECRSAGIALILDEIKTGISRCGPTFAFEAENVEPDILCLGKSLSNGFPLSVVVFKEDFCPRDFPASYLILQTTFSGHAVACARAQKVLEIMKRDRLEEHVAQTGILFLDMLRSLLERENTVGDIRGTGLLCAIEFVSDKASRRPSIAALYRFLAVSRESGIHLETIFRNVAVFTPPLILSRSDIDEVHDRLEKGLSQ